LTRKNLTVLFALIGLLILFQFFFNQTKKSTLDEQSEIILEQINEVNKLISLEGNFAEVYTLDQTQKLFFDLIPIPKKAIIIAKAKTFVAYDLEHINYELDKQSKTVIISNIPEPEIIIEPKLELYDLKANILPFTKEELNLLNERAIQLLREEAHKEGFVDLAKENLYLNLEQINLVAKTQGWSVTFKDEN